MFKVTWIQTGVEVDLASAHYGSQHGTMVFDRQVKSYHLSFMSLGELTEFLKMIEELHRDVEVGGYHITLVDPVDGSLLRDDEYRCHKCQTPHDSLSSRIVPIDTDLSPVLWQCQECKAEGDILDWISHHEVSHPWEDEREIDADGEPMF